MALVLFEALGASARHGEKKLLARARTAPAELLLRTFKERRPSGWSGDAPAGHTLGPGSFVQLGPSLRLPFARAI